jgi:hypothetical protein
MSKHSGRNRIAPGSQISWIEIAHQEMESQIKRNMNKTTAHLPVLSFPPLPLWRVYQACSHRATKCIRNTFVSYWSVFVGHYRPKDLRRMSNSIKENTKIPFWNLQNS